MLIPNTTFQKKIGEFCKGFIEVNETYVRAF